MSGLTLTPELDVDLGCYLALERSASRPYGAFVYRSPAVHAALHASLLATGRCEFATPHGRLAVDADGPVGMLAALSAGILRRRRLESAYWLARSSFVHDDRDLTRRIHLAAHALVQPRDDDFYVSRVAVAPRARGRGIADAMLELLLAEARAAGTSRCVLEVDPSNAAAVALYRRQGFDIVDVRSVVDPQTGRALTYNHMALGLHRMP